MTLLSGFSGRQQFRCSHCSALLRIDKNWSQAGSIGSFFLSGLIAHLSGVRGLTFVVVTLLVFLAVASAMGMVMTKLFGLPVVPVDQGTISWLGEYDDTPSELLEFRLIFTG